MVVAAPSEYITLWITFLFNMLLDFGERGKQTDRDTEAQMREKHWLAASWMSPSKDPASSIPCPLSTPRIKPETSWFLGGSSTAEPHQRAINTYTDATKSINYKLRVLIFYFPLPVSSSAIIITWWHIVTSPARHWLFAWNTFIILFAMWHWSLNWKMLMRVYQNWV